MDFIKSHNSFKSILENAEFSKNAVLNYLAKNPEVYKEAMDIVLYGEHPYAWRAGWVMGNYFEQNDKRLNPYIDTIIEMVENSNPDGLQRELLRLLLLSEFDEEKAGRIVDICLSIWESTKKQASPRIIALKILVKYSDKYTDLKPELIALTEVDGFVNRSGAARSTQIIRNKLIEVII